MNDFLYFTLALLLGLGLNIILIRFSRKLGAISAGAGSDQIRWASKAKPLVGGIAFFLVFLLAIVAHALQNGTQAEPLQSYIPLLLASLIGFIVGLSDDAYNTRPMLKFVGQVFCGLLLISFGTYIQLFGIPMLDYALTLFWVVGIMNSFNMLDNMDAVSSIFSFGVIVVALFVLAGQSQYGTLMWSTLLALAGAHVGFLILNWNPSKLYMGDTGTQFLGVFLAYIGIRYFWNMPAADGQFHFSQQVLMPLLAFVMTIMDTTFVTVARIARGQSPFVGGRDHITHHLVYLGVADRWVPVITGSVGLTGGILAVVFSQVITPWTSGLALLSAAFLVVLFGTFALLYRRGAAINRMRLAAVGKATQPAPKPEVAAPKVVATPQPAHQAATAS
jgi:UDP-GlcNAc:undecaprenyl-phosphate GlcNAc-1-phosphate transferase